MATNVLPPPPVNDKPGSFTWLEWYRQLRNYVSTSGSVPWYIINFSGSSIEDIAARDHNKLQSVQGGGSNEKYHLTASDYNRVVAQTLVEKTEILVPLTGFTETISNSTTIYLVTPAGTIATGTITMPASPTNNQVVRICTTKEITTLTHSANTGQTLLGGLTTATANGHASWVYQTSTSTWYRIE